MADWSYAARQARARAKGTTVYGQRVARVRREGLPTKIARGHGPVPIRIARGIERQRKGHPRALPVRTQEKYRAGIARYEREEYGRLVTSHSLRQRGFPDREGALEWLRETLPYLSPQSSYVQILREPTGEWTVTVLR